MNTGEFPPDQRIRQASDADSKAVAEILGSAFAEDPVFRWICAGGAAVCRRVFGAEHRLLYRFHDHVHINEAETGAAMWLPPGVSPAVPFGLPMLGVALQMLRHGGFRSLQRGTRLNEKTAEFHLEEPHFYLHAIGARSGCQGRGIGSALLKHGLEICDSVGYPAYLESSNIRNNPLYERFGFEITGEFTLPGEGPTVWLMRRPAVSP
jgi:ribosomal protein S18 acetylase RimI-like enzyme